MIKTLWDKKMRQLATKTENQRRIYFYKGFVPFKNLRQRLYLWIGPRMLTSPFWAWVDTHVALYPEFSEPASYDDMYYVGDSVPCNVLTRKQYDTWMHDIKRLPAVRTIQKFLGKEYWVSFGNGRLHANLEKDLPF